MNLKMSRCKHINKLQWSQYHDNGYGYYFSTDVEVCKNCDYITIDGYTVKELEKREINLISKFRKTIGEELAQKHFEDLVLTDKEAKLLANYSEEINELTYLSMVNGYAEMLNSMSIEEIAEYEVKEA